MSDIAISIENLSKRYVLGHQREKGDGLRHGIEEAIRSPLRWFLNRKKSNQSEEFWALKNVSFDVKQGEVVGVIGRNGAGKSTLLKIVSRITEPTEGRVQIKGRIASLLEVGTGFHPELTGRENIFLNGAILGMSRVEIRKKFDEIVAFSEVEQFLDTPVKRYSSGMYVRLAFAVAAHLEPEILIVDEVLAVGDADFQKKCLGKMQDVSKSGRTVLFVSHNTAAIIRLCQRCVLLNGGKLKLVGLTDEVIAQYLRSGSQTDGSRFWNDKNQCSTDPRLLIHAVRVVSYDGAVTGHIDIRHSFSIQVEYTILEALPPFRVALQFVTGEGTVAFHTSDSSDPDCQMITRQAGRYITKCFVPGNLLNDGYYSVSLSFDIPMQKVLVLEERALGFAVEQTGGTSARFQEKWPGVVCPHLDWNTETSDKSDTPQHDGGGPRENVKPALLRAPS